MAATATVNNLRYRYGDAKPIKVPIKATFGFQIGDSLYIDPTDTVTPPDQSGSLYPAKPVGGYTWQTAISDPTAAPVTAEISTPQGGGFAAGSSYKVEYTYVTTDGLESGPSSGSTALSLASGQGINVTGVSVPSGVVTTNWYVSGSAGTGYQFVAQTPYGAGLNIVGPPPADASAPPSAQGLSATVLTQVALAKLFIGISGQFYDGNALATTGYGVKLGYARCDTGGVFDLACASATFNEGDMLALAKDTGNNIGNQLFVATTLKECAVARVVQSDYLVTTVRAEILPAKFKISHVKF